MEEFNLACSENMKKYFEYLILNTNKTYEIATKARKLKYDPEDFVEIQLAKNMAERVVGIISVVAPQIVGSGVVERIVELEKQYGSQDFRVALTISYEIAIEKFCKFESKKEAIEVGIRTGFAYVTVGVVSSPLEGLTSIEIKPRRDGKGEYFRLNYAGPIRNAGGTAAAMSVIIGDYVRKKLGYSKYDPDEKEIKRCYAELEDYHQYVANLQYFPYKEESEFLLSNIPVEISGDPSEKWEVSNATLKDLPRVETNLLRSGYCLIHSSCIPLKAPKLWKKISKFKDEFELNDWNFLEEHIKLQKELKSKGENVEEVKKEVETNSTSEPGLLISKKIKPDTVYIKDLVGGRPVLGHPMRSGAFRLRYGRSRGSGLSGQATHPATLGVLNDLIAVGTQLKVERPGKAAAFTACDNLMGPIVKLKDKSVIRVETYEQAKSITKEVEEIIYLGDALVPYGDFLDRAHILIPPGYVEEYWILELKKALEEQVGEFNLELYAKYLEL
ncbi:MAG: DNA polymerase II large subunit, partial [Candidatus Woesearchaeota archaeon]